MNRGDRREPIYHDEELKEKLLARATEQVGPQHYGAERQESGEAKAERLVREELARQAWSETDLGRLRKGGPGKVRIARRLRAETTMTLAWIARRLRMGLWPHVSNLLATPLGIGMDKAGRRTDVNSRD